MGGASLVAARAVECQTDMRRQVRLWRPPTWRGQAGRPGPSAHHGVWVEVGNFGARATRMPRPRGQYHQVPVSAKARCGFSSPPANGRQNPIFLWPRVPRRRRAAEDSECVQMSSNEDREWLPPTPRRFPASQPPPARRRPAAACWPVAPASFGPLPSASPIPPRTPPVTGSSSCPAPRRRARAARTSSTSAPAAASGARCAASPRPTGRRGPPCARSPAGSSREPRPPAPGAPRAGSGELSARGGEGRAQREGVTGMGGRQAHRARGGRGGPPQLYSRADYVRGVRHHRRQAPCKKGTRASRSISRSVSRSIRNTTRCGARGRPLACYRRRREARRGLRDGEVRVELFS